MRAIVRTGWIVAIVVGTLMLIAAIHLLHGQEPPCPPSALALINEKCVKCHSGDKPPNGLRLDTVDNMVRGGKSGPAIKVGDPDNSLLYKMIAPRDGMAGKMPPFMPLTEDEVKLIRSWIYTGAMHSTMGRCKP